MWSNLNRIRSGAFVALIIVIGLLSATPGSVVAHGNVDQSSIPLTPVGGGVTQADRQVQTFTPTVSNVSGVDVVLAGFSVAFDTGTIGVAIYADGGDGVVLGSTSRVVTLPEFSTTTIVHFDFSSPVPVTPGATYAIGVLDLDAIFFVWAHGVGDT